MEDPLECPKDLETKIVDVEDLMNINQNPIPYLYLVD